jgi:hypothetical protein
MSANLNFMSVFLARLARMPRRRKWGLGTLAVFVLVAVALFLSAKPLANRAVGIIYQNVTPPDGGEMAVTVTSYPSSSRVVSIIGGKGEGLNCSLPSYVDILFDAVGHSKVRDAPVRERFRQACVFHDLCYRHGLATYGYTQNDCDQILQEEAMRICMVAFSERKSEGCQLDAKKVLVGVTNGGFGSYQSWRTSTYFEFDSNPSSSDHFAVGRVIEHPFKKVDPGGTRDDPDELMLMFDTQPSGTTVACRNCKNRNFTARELLAAGLLTPTAPATIATAVGSTTPGTTSPALDFSQQAIEHALDDVVRPKINQVRPVGLPPIGTFAAPQLLTAQNGQQFIVWIDRKTPLNTETCIIIADPKNLLTHTRPKDVRCLQSDNPRLTVALADMYASSPQPELVALAGKIGLIGTGLTLEKGPLDICITTDLRTMVPSGARPKCFALQTPEGDAVTPIMGAFQNFPIVKGERHIYLARLIYTDTRKKEIAGTGRALVFDVDRPMVPATPARQRDDTASLRVPPIKFDIDDTYDPMLPLNRDKDDLRLISLKKDRLEGTVGIYEINLKDANPAPIPIETLVGPNATPVKLDASWANRPVLVLEDSSAADGVAKTQLVLSRSLVTTTEEIGDTRDTVRLEFLVLERNASDPAGKPLRQVRGLACNVIYTLHGANPSRPCLRSSVQVGEKRPSPAQMLQGAQLLAGRLSSPGQTDLDLAMPDACYADQPIILRPATLDAAADLKPVRNLTVLRNSNKQALRQVACGALKDEAAISHPIPAPE